MRPARLISQSCALHLAIVIEGLRDHERHLHFILMMETRRTRARNREIAPGRLSELTIGFWALPTVLAGRKGERPDKVGDRLSIRFHGRKCFQWREPGGLFARTNALSTALIRVWYPGPRLRNQDKMSGSI